MWGRHASRCGGLFSSARIAQLGRTYSSPAAASAADGVSNSISHEEWLKAWKMVAPNGRARKHIGLAVSGGVDSMALALLYANAFRGQLTEPTKNSLPEPMAFILDHKLREGSSEEAKWVAQQLIEKLGIKSHVIPLQWPDGFDSATSTKIESLARALRYRALGLACREHVIAQLLVAHHSDDQAESTMLRLIEGRWRTGLRGTKPVSPIAECHGIHGVHRSSLQASDTLLSPFPIESGGVELLRPLLGFSKERLIATCREHSVPWAEDATNQDKTLTKRNAIRFIMRSHRLPEALSKDALVSLASRMNGRVQRLEDRAEELFNQCKLKLDITTASLLIRLPRKDELIDRPIITESDDIEAFNTGTLLLNRVIRLVSPKDKTYSVPGVASATSFIYPLASENEESESSITTELVWIRRWEGLSLFDEAGWDSNVFIFSRPPFSAKDAKSEQITIPAHHPGDQFHCFDNRFWLRIQNNSSTSLVVRAVVDEDLQNLPRPQKGKHFKVGSDGSNVRELLGLIYPQHLRKTIPAIFSIDKDGRQKFVAFPTVNSRPLLSRFEDKVSWEVRYKKVDLGVHAQKKSVLTSALQTANSYRRLLKPKDRRKDAQEAKLGERLGLWRSPNEETPEEARTAWYQEEFQNIRKEWVERDSAIKERLDSFQDNPLGIGYLLRASAASAGEERPAQFAVDSDISGNAAEATTIPKDFGVRGPELSKADDHDGLERLLQIAESDGKNRPPKQSVRASKASPAEDLVAWPSTAVDDELMEENEPIHDIHVAASPFSDTHSQTTTITPSSSSTSNAEPQKSPVDLEGSSEATTEARAEAEPTKVHDFSMTLEEMLKTNTRQTEPSKRGKRLNRGFPDFPMQV